MAFSPGVPWIWFSNGESKHGPTRTRFRRNVHGSNASDEADVMLPPGRLRLGNKMSKLDGLAQPLRTRRYLHDLLDLGQNTPSEEARDEVTRCVRVQCNAHTSSLLGVDWHVVLGGAEEGPASPLFVEERPRGFILIRLPEVIRARNWRSSPLSACCRAALTLVFRSHPIPWRLGISCGAI